MTPKIGLMLLNLGGPDSQKAVQPFLYNLFSDPDIISLFGLRFLQKPLAKLISSARHKSVATYYAKIGGGSPIMTYTQAQADALESLLKAEGFNVKAYIAMRYWHPFTHDALERAVRDGVEYLITVPLYPQFSYTTTGSSVNELKKVMKNHKINLPLLEMPAYYDHPGYQAAFVDTIREVMDNTSWTCPKEKVTILFSAHSLPESHVKKTGDPYPQHIDETIRLVMSHAFPQNPWRLSFQSKVGPIPWLSPSTEEVIEEMAKEGIKDVAVVPISFVSEHLETLYEIDILYGELAQEVGITNFKRAQTVNTHPQYIAALADLVKQQIQQHIPDNHKGVAVASH